MTDRRLVERLGLGQTGLGLGDIGTRHLAHIKPGLRFLQLADENLDVLVADSQGFLIAARVGVGLDDLRQDGGLSPAQVLSSCQYISIGSVNRGSNPSTCPYRLVEAETGLATIAAAFWPKSVIVRLSDFKSNEYRKLIGGARYEPEEENPMLGFRGAARYLAGDFRECFELECEAMKFVRETMGLTNVELMVPFVRTTKEAEGVIALLAKHGLKRGVSASGKPEDALKVIMMCELPSNAILAKEFLEYFDGFSIGSNDLTQLTLGLDRDSGLVAEGFDERDPAVKAMLSMAIKACKDAGKYVGICGQGPSDHIDLAQWLVEQGIGSMSLNPDTVIDTWQRLAENQKTH